jgi:hypothetical protein
MMRDSIVVAGSLAQKPHQAGHTWQFLQYLLGFKELGWDVLFVDRLEPEMCIDAEGAPCPVERSVNIAYVQAVMEEFGLADSWAVLYGDGARVYGVPRPEVLERTRRSALLLNVMGFLDDEDILAAASRRVFLDTDPGFGQMWRELGLADLFAGHDDHVTIAENIGRRGCGVPTCGIDWVTTKQPVALAEWTLDGPPGRAFTSIGAWRGPYAPLEYGGATYGLRVHEFRKFAELPARAPGQFEIALDIDAAEVRDLELLERAGWSLLAPPAVAFTPAVYRDFVRASLAEFMVAKGMYVQTHSGWFSERSICYLASGRPVLAQDTGLGELYESGEGLLTFSTLDEAVAGAEEISRDPRRHSRRAREVAEEHFASGRVLGRLLERLGVA